MKIRLVKLSEQYKEQLFDMMDEWTSVGEKIVPYAIRKNDYHNFEHYLENLELKEEIDGKVPDSTYFCLDEDKNSFVGAVNIRHYLTEEMLINAGHIGDGIRPSERRKGYATAMIGLALKEAKKLGIDRVLMCCEKENIGSAKSIRNNGGALENEIVVNGVVQQRYWIENNYSFVGKETEKMKWFIASDIHGSAYYCEKLLEAYKREQADKILLLGDVLYHGPRNDLPEGYAPKKVIAMLNELENEILCVRGNCEAEVDQMVLNFPVLADYAILTAGKKMIFVTHGHVYNNNHLPPLHKGDILLHGHTHVPVCEAYETHTYMNPGSVSIPKENSPHSYMTFDGVRFEWKTLEGEVYKQYTLENS